MPYRSDAQRRWAHTAEGKKALGGKAAVHEWDEATKGKKLPEKVGKTEDLEKAVKMPSTSVPSVKPPNPSNAGQLSVKSPKAKKMADPFGKPSLFFKAESIQKLHSFLEGRKKK